MRTNKQIKLERKKTNDQTKQGRKKARQDIKCTKQIKNAKQ